MILISNREDIVSILITGMKLGIITPLDGIVIFLCMPKQTTTSVFLLEVNRYGSIDRLLKEINVSVFTPMGHEIEYRITRPLPLFCCVWISLPISMIVF